MIYKGTDKDAFKRAAKGLTAKSRSRKYRKYKAQNEKKGDRETVLPYSPRQSYTPSIPKQLRVKSSTGRTTPHRQSTKYIEKKTILDDVRDWRSSKIVSNISNSLATFVVKCGGQQWDNTTRNTVRSLIALAISEVTNKVLEKPLEIVENIKLFIRVGKAIYKIIAWIDKTTKLWITDDKSIDIVSENDIEYIRYLREYPHLDKPTEASNAGTNSMKYKVGDVVLLIDGRTVRIVKVNSDTKTYYAVATTAADNTQITITEADICGIARK